MPRIVPRSIIFFVMHRGDLYVTNSIFMSDFKLLLRLSASAPLLLYLPVFVN
jgi:hypothetical protein